MNQQEQRAMSKQRIVEIVVKVIVAALTAYMTAISTTSCAGYGPLPSPVL